MAGFTHTLAGLTPLGLMAIGVAAGFLIARPLLLKVRDRLECRHQQLEARLLTRVSHIVVLWCVIAGIYAAVLSVPTSAQLLTVIQKVLMIVILVSATLMLARVAADLIDAHSHAFTKALGAKSTRRTTSLLATSAQLVITLIGGLVVLGSLGISITPLLTALGVGGLAVALALQGLLSNMFSGLEVIASHHVRPGDYVKLDVGAEGTVLDINWRNTTIRDITNTLVVVPNDKLASAVIWNYNLPAKDVFTLAIDVPVKRDSNLDTVEQTALEVAKEVVKEVANVEGAPDPFVRFTGLTTDQLTVTTFLQAADYMDGSRVRHEFIKRVQQRLEEHRR